MSNPKTKQSTPCVHCQVFSPKTRHSHRLRNTKSVLFYLEQFREKRQEHLITLSLDSLSRLITRRIVTIGLLDIALAHPREVFADPLQDHIILGAKRHFSFRDSSLL
jgi:DNA repair protein RadC